MRGARSAFSNAQTPLGILFEKRSELIFGSIYKTATFKPQTYLEACYRAIRPACRELFTSDNGDYRHDRLYKRAPCHLGVYPGAFVRDSRDILSSVQ